MLDFIYSSMARPHRIPYGFCWLDKYCVQTDQSSSLFPRRCVVPPKAEALKVERVRARHD